jgi:hypothetical protein
VSGAEDPNRLNPARAVTVEDVRELVGAATPHFALQIRDRLNRLIGGLAPDDPARAEGEHAIVRLESLAREGQAAGPVSEHEAPLPSLSLPERRGDAQPAA